MCHLIDIAVPCDSRVALKEEKGLIVRELRALWQFKVKVVPVVGALGTIIKTLQKHLQEIGTP